MTGNPRFGSRAVKRCALCCKLIAVFGSWLAGWLAELGWAG